MLGDIEKNQRPHLSVELHDAKMGHPLHPPFAKHLAWFALCLHSV